MVILAGEVGLVVVTLVGVVVGVGTDVVVMVGGRAGLADGRGSAGRSAFHVASSKFSSAARVSYNINAW